MPNYESRSEALNAALRLQGQSPIPRNAVEIVSDAEKFLEFLEGSKK